MHMIDVVQKLKEIAESGYDNEDIQRGITAASKHQVTEDIQSEYQDLLKSMDGKNERARTKLLGDFITKHDLPGMYDPKSGYFVHIGNEGPQVVGYGSKKALEKLDSMGLVPDNIRAEKGLPPKEKPKAKSDKYGDTNSDIGQGEDPSKPKPDTNSDIGQGEDPSANQTKPKPDADPAGMTGATAAATPSKPNKPDADPAGMTGATAAATPSKTKKDREVDITDLPPPTAAGGKIDPDVAASIGAELDATASSTNSDIGTGEDPNKFWDGGFASLDRRNRQPKGLKSMMKKQNEHVENTALEDILRLAGRSGVLGMNKPVSIVAESLELDEGAYKNLMWGYAEDMELEEFLDKFGHNEANKDFWEAINGEIDELGNIVDEAEVQECDAVEEEAVEETVEVPVSTLADLMRLAGYTNYQEKVEEYANDPAEEYMDAEEQLIGLSGGMNGPKKMYPAAAGGDNPMDQEPREIEEVAEAQEDFTTSFYKKYDAFLESLNKDN